MAHAQARYQPAALRGPQGRQAPLNGISVAGAAEPLAQAVALVAAPSPSGLHREAMLAQPSAKVGGSRAPETGTGAYSAPRHARSDCG